MTPVQHVSIDSLKPASWNPRSVRDERFSQLCRSLEADPDFLEQRPILAQADGTVYAGNHRLLAARHLGWTTVPAIVADVPELLAKQRAMIDNNSNADWIEPDLAALLSELETDGTDLSLLGFEAGELDRLLAQADGRVVEPDAVTTEWQGMPAFEHEDQTADAAFIIRIFLKDADDLAALGRLLGRDLTDRKFFWFGKQPQGTTYEVYDEAPA